MGWQKTQKKYFLSNIKLGIHMRPRSRESSYLNHGETAKDVKLEVQHKSSI